MSARAERDRLAGELASAHAQIARLESELQRRRDALTGLLAVEPFRARLTAELGRSRRYERPCSLVLLQLDRLAEIHRDHGFDVGDRVLVALADVLRAGTRAQDVCSRTGTDEFAVLLAETDEQAARACVERLILELEVLDVGPLRGVSASAGIAPLRSGEDAVELLERAGGALADARAAGGGRMLVASPDEPQGTGVVERLRRHDAVEALALALLERDRYTGEHSESVVELSGAVARALGLGSTEVDHVRAAALLHDIGKVGIPDAILNKPGPLTPDERAVMAEHPVIGERILRSIPGFAPVALIVRHEHESWDGSGYPDGLAGDQIPLGSRIILACDAYHAMTSDRPYRSRMSHVDAFNEITRCAGQQFDPDVTAALIGEFYNQRRGGRSLAS